MKVTNDDAEIESLLRTGIYKDKVEVSSSEKESDIRLKKVFHGR